MINIKKITAPLLFLLFFSAQVLLSQIKNEISWGYYATDITKYYGIFFIFITSLITGYYISPNITKKIPADHHESISFSRLYFLVVFSLLFIFLKIYILGDIPLTSNNPLIRSIGQNLGGLIDYPARLITLLAILSFYAYHRNLAKKVIPIIIIGYLFNLLMLNRSELLLMTFSMFVIFMFDKRIKFYKFTIYFFLLLFSAFSIISLLAIIRYGSQNIGSGLSLLQLSLWIIHGDLIGALNFGSFVSDIAGHQQLNGRYTFGEYFSIINPSYGHHGSDYLRDVYLPSRLTAQSVAAPFNYYLDFGVSGVIIITLAMGAVYKNLRIAFLENKSHILYILFLYFLYNLYLSTRNGLLPTPPMFVYYSMALLFCFKTKKDSIVSKIKMISDVAFVATWIVSFLGAVTRV
ncbi:O-antigen polymerase [Thalassospira sp. TSL5-1]|uniref:O-antigen polymerase n=1 Tax=Thalassospira sp. TSL5-1 TaxID=1544451 RepID=UPI00093B4285|nr:O-antigen polymerase [Thalassospira sp. TSL5-1]OKH87470.1 hypothetical protein LF95_11750 [Thalassospira sp. TSL5-1]